MGPIAAYHGDYETASLLLDHGASVHERDSVGRTSLHWAVHNVDDKLVELLLEHGARVNTRNGSGTTPLHEAVFSYDQCNAESSEYALRVLDLLLSYGADVNAQTQGGLAPLDFIECASRSEEEWGEVKRLFRQHGGHSGV
ncbi:MAG: ankyrin repeat domain-containing protein [Planctomycetota bacterium]